MKKWKVMIPAMLLILAVLLTACGKSGGSTTTGGTVSSSGTSAKPASYTISNEVLFDEDFGSMTVLKAEDQSFWGFTLNVECENKTADKNLTFSIDTCVVNGYDIDPLWSDTVAAGKKSKTEITFGTSAFENCGIQTADKILIKMRVYDSDNWDADNYLEKTFTIYPTGMSDSQVVIPARPTGAGEVVLVDDDKCTVILVGTYNDPLWGYSVKCYTENKTSDTHLSVSWDNVSVNGYMIDPYYGAQVLPGSRKVNSASFSDSDLTDNGIETVTEIEFTLRITDADDWFADPLFEQTFTYNPQN